jgi:diadenosine tetraphosphate (Ap4A) HIT family hydrolase
VTTEEACPLCAELGGTLVWQGRSARVVQVDDPDYPGYCRVIWNAHVPEMSDLDEAERSHLWAIVDRVERTLRDMLLTDKINLASLGNQVPHLHWHVIPRWRDDRNFPDPIWALARRAGAVHRVGVEPDDPWPQRQRTAARLAQPLAHSLETSFPW